jgi:hypothetical protein
MSDTELTSMLEPARWIEIFTRIGSAAHDVLVRLVPVPRRASLDDERH